MKRTKPGPMPSEEGPMPGSAFTAPPEYHVFLLMIADGAISAGLRAAVDRLVEIDPEAATTMDLAKSAVEHARQKLGSGATQRSILTFIKR